MLYDGLSEALSAARGALARGEPDVKGAAVGRAADILAVLKAGLNADRGGDVAGNLARLYEYMERRLTEGNLRNDADAFEELVTINDTLRGAWLAIPEDARRSSLAA